VRQVHSQVLQDVALRLQRTFDNFFKKTKKGEKAGYLGSKDGTGTTPSHIHSMETA
jgi:hypothetical protein